MVAPTSFYRQYARPGDAATDPVDPGNRYKPGEPDVPLDFTRQRKAAPAAFLLPNTRKWLDALPRGVQPHALRKLYPRIANLIAAMWADREGPGPYFDELLVDWRRGRRGFPPDVMNDLRVLRDCHAALYPNAMGKWDHERRKP
jgi:hypothetical protein